MRDEHELQTEEIELICEHLEPVEYGLNDVAQSLPQRKRQLIDRLVSYGYLSRETFVERDALLVCCTHRGKKVASIHTGKAADDADSRVEREARYAESRF